MSDKLEIRFQQSTIYLLGSINEKGFGLEISTRDGEQFDDGQGGGSILTAEEEDIVKNSSELAKELKQN